MSTAFGATLAVCIVLVMVTGVAVYLFMHRKKAEETPKPISFQQMQTIISEEIKNVHELVTVRKNFTSVISFANDKKIPLINVHMPGSDRKLLMDYSGTIVCGCDLDEIRFSQDRNFGNRVKIIVPQSRILDIYANVNSFKIHHKDAGIFAENIKIEEQNDLIAEDLKCQEQNALQEGLLARADENVRQMLTSIIAKRGLNQSFDWEIVFLNKGNSKVLDVPKNILR